jgi:TM2 domain-containing membrane protein YozV
MPMKTKGGAYFLWFFLGFFSAHRFYLGKTCSAILYLVTGQLFGIGWIIDLFLLSGMVERYNINEELKIIRAATFANARK